jgi:hypothetical protein
MTEWRTIGQLADLVGAYCWVEHRLFELTGHWASAPDQTPGEQRVFLAGVSRHHAEVAARWWDRLPVRAGVDPTTLVTEPTGPLAESLRLLGAETDPSRRLAGLTGVVLPHLLTTYEEHRTQATPVSQAPVLDVLAEAARAGAAEVSVGQALCELEKGPEGVEFAAELERLFGGPPCICPVARAS